ncbi:MAG: iron ABC transporter permease [Phycisphaerae bacterium]|nr:iron ABC transporter permease [Phycisphaerae bacterium]
MRRRLPSLSLTLLLLAVLAAVLLAPIWAVVRAGFEDDAGGFTLVWFEDVFSYSAYMEGLWNSVWLAGFSTLLCLVISIPLVMLAERFNFAGKRWWLALVQVPMILPPFVGAIGMKGLLSRNGGLNLLLAHWGWIDPGNPIDWLQYPFWSCVVLEALYLYPITFLNVQAALANIDPALDEAARNLGSGGWRRFWRITLPLMRPGIFAGSTIVFIWAFTELGTPLMVGYRDVTAVQVFDQLSTTNPTGEAYALVTVMLVVSVVLYLVGKLILGRPVPGMMAKATVASAPQRLGWRGTLLVTLPFALVFVVAVLPHIAVVLGSLTSTGVIELSPEKLTWRFHATLLHDVVALGEPGRGMAAVSVVNSFKYSIIATVVDLVLGFAIAYLVVRRRSWLTALLDSLAMLPLAVPGLVMAFGYFVMTQGETPLEFLNPLKHDPTPLLVIAYAVRRLPFQVRSCAAGLEQASEALEEAAINLGAGPLRTMLRITVPLLTANFIAGGLLVFSRSMLEVSDSLILAFDKGAYPMTKAIYDITDNPEVGLQMAAALGVWGMIILTATIIGASLALGKRLGALFRV